MKLPNPIRWGFSPNKSKKPILKTLKGRILWGGIKTQHITDQYFDGACEKLLRMFNDNEAPSHDAHGLYALARKAGLGGYGTIHDPRFGQNYHGGSIVMAMDDEFWGEMFDALCGKLKVQMIIEDES